VRAPPSAAPRRRPPFRRLALLTAVGLTALPTVLFWPVVSAATHRTRAAVDGGIAGSLRWVVLACLIYLLVLYAVLALLIVFSTMEGALRWRQHRSEDFESLERSRFTIPVSIIVPVYNEQSVVIGSTESLLRQSYPEYELIVVDDGSTDATFETLQEAFDLEARDVFFK
jgi:cellulose synthase/poly-beta-1,6-N-acetylglucosamine synthase-like glycosyltransferase